MRSATPTKRHPWLAAFLSCVMPGMGQFYCGAILRCLTFVVLCSGTALLGIPALIPRMEIPGLLVVLFAGVALLTYVVAVVDAFFVARRTRVDYVPKDYNRWYAYVLLYIAVSAGHLFSMLYARDHLIQPFKAGSDSMYPTIGIGEQVFAAKQAYAVRDPAPGDIVVFHNPQNRSQMFIKRVIAVGGDAIEIREGITFVNDTPLDRHSVQEPANMPSRTAPPGKFYAEGNRSARYMMYFSGKSTRLRNYAKTIVPPQHCFVLGDNRDDSLDSRSFGPISVVSVVGKVEFMYAPIARMGSVDRVARSPR